MAPRRQRQHLQLPTQLAASARPPPSVDPSLEAPPPEQPQQQRTRPMVAPQTPPSTLRREPAAATTSTFSTATAKFLFRSPPPSCKGHSGPRAGTTALRQRATRRCGSDRTLIRLRCALRRMNTASSRLSAVLCLSESTTTTRTMWNEMLRLRLQLLLMGMLLRTLPLLDHWLTLPHPQTVGTPHRPSLSPPRQLPQRPRRRHRSGSSATSGQAST